MPEDHSGSLLVDGYSRCGCDFAVLMSRGGCEEEVNCTRLIRGLIVALPSQQDFSVLHGSQGLETPASHALHSQRVSGFCECGSVALLAGSVQSRDAVFQSVLRLNYRPCVNSTPVLGKQKDATRAAYNAQWKQEGMWG